MNTQTNRTLTAALTLALAVGLTACGTGDDTSTGGTVESPSAAETSTEATTPATDDDADDTDDSADDTSEGTGAGSTGGADAGGDLTAAALQAVGTAEAEAGGTAYEVDDQDDDGSWEVDVAVGDRSVEVTVSADGRTVVEADEDDDLDDDDRAGLQAATITLPDAISTALAEVDGDLDDVELEEEDGSHFWVVSVDATEGEDDVEVYVDVSSGEVVEVDA